MNESRPNVLLIFPDQWRGDSLSCLGHPLTETPFLDELAAGGTLFTSAYSNAPTYIPARACLMTGRTPATTGRHGYRDHDPWPYRDVFPRLMRDAGYQTFVAGKTHFHPPRACLGFEQMALYDNQRHTPAFKSDYDIWLEKETDGRIQDTAQLVSSNSMIVRPWTHDACYHASHWTVTAAIDMLERRDPSRPFLLQLGFHRPHPPLDPPVEEWRRFEHRPLPEVPVGDWAEGFAESPWCTDGACGTAPRDCLDRARRAYYAQLNHLDFQIGRLRRWLQLRGQEHETLILFCSDHGEMLGDHHMFRKSGPFEGAAKVPLLVRPPRSWQAPGGLRNDAPVGLYDIMPTLLDATGVRIPEGVEGSSLLPFVRGEDAAWRDWIHFEHCTSPIGPWQGLCNGKEKYIWETLTGREFFFDLERDPEERSNRATSPEARDRLALWRKRLAEQLTVYESDGLVRNGSLTPGQQVPVARAWLQTSVSGDA